MSNCWLHIRIHRWRASNIIKHALNLILDQLGIPRGGRLLHAFRHGRVTILRKNGVPGDLQKLWIGHSSLRTTDRYSHTNQDFEYRRTHASRLGFENTVVGPMDPMMKVGTFSVSA